MMHTTRRIGSVSVHAMAFVVCIVLTGCNDPLGPSKSTPLTAVKTNAQELGRLCTLPPGVLSVEWSTYTIGDDWGLVARIKMAPADVGALMSKMTLAHDRSVALFAGLPGWLGADANVFTKSGAGFESTIPVYQPVPFTKSPLLNGFVVNPQPDTVLVGLHTS